MKKKNLLIIWLTLVIYLVIGGIGVNNAVLCFGEDGHIKVETGLCCNSAEASTQQLNTYENDLNNDNCGKCTDIYLYTDKTDNNILNVQKIHYIHFDKDKTIYFYYPVQVIKSESKPDKFTFFEQLSQNYPKFSFINTTTTVLLN